MTFEGLFQPKLILFQLEILYDSMKKLSSLNVTTYSCVCVCVCVLYIWIQKTDVIPISPLRLTKENNVWSTVAWENSLSPNMDMIDR